MLSFYYNSQIFLFLNSTKILLFKFKITSFLINRIFLLNFIMTPKLFFLFFLKSTKIFLYKFEKKLISFLKECGTPSPVWQTSRECAEISEGGILCWAISPTKPPSDWTRKGSTRRQPPRQSSAAGWCHLVLLSTGRSTFLFTKPTLKRFCSPEDSLRHNNYCYGYFCFFLSFLIFFAILIIFN